MAFGRNEKELKFRLTADKTAVDKAFNEVGISAKKLAGGLVATFSVASFGKVVKDAIEFGDQIDKMSKRLGISAQTLTEYKHVADLSGTSFETLAKAMQKTAQNIEMAGDGMATQKRALEALGLSYKNLAGLSIDQQFEAIGNALQGVESDSKRVQLAVDLMGRAGVEVIPVFSDGAAAIADMREEARQLGITFGDDVAAKMAEADDNMTRLEGSMRGLGQTLAIEVVPYVNDFVVALNQLLTGETEYNHFFNSLELAALDLADAISFGTSVIVDDAREMVSQREQTIKNEKAALAEKDAWLEKSKALGYATEVTFAAKRATDNHAASTKKSTKATKDDTKEKKESAKAADELAQAQRRQAEQLQQLLARPFENALDNIQNTVSDTFVSIFDGSIDSAADAADAMKKIFYRLAAELATLAIFQPQAIGAGFSIGGAGGSAASSGGIGGSLLQSGIGQGVKLGLGGAIDSWGAAALPSLFGTGAPAAGVIGPQLPGLLGGAGIGLSAVALPIAGLALTSLLGGVFGGSRPHPASTFEFSGIGNNGSLQDLSLLAKHMDTSTAKAFSDALSQAFAGLQGAGLDLSNIGTVQGGVNDGRGFLQLVGHGTFGFDPNDAQAASDSVNFLIKQIVSSAKNFHDVFEDDVISAFDELIVGGRDVGEVLQDLVDIATLDVRRADFNAQVQDRILQLTDEQAWKISQINKEFDALLQTAQGLGADETQVELLRQLTLAQETGNDAIEAAAQEQADEFTKMAENFEKLANSLQSTLDSLLLGSNSALSPQERLALAAQNYAASIGTDSQGSAATAYIDVARENYASGAQYKEIFNNVTGSLSATIADLNRNASAARMNASLAQQQVTYANVPQSDGTMLAIRELAKEQAVTNKYVQALAVTARVQ